MLNFLGSKDEDSPYSDKEMEDLEKVLFPKGVDFDENSRKEINEYYKLLCQSAEHMASRRQTVNSFFLSINSLLLAGIGFFYKEALELFAHPNSHHNHAHNLTLLAGAVALIGFLIDCKLAQLMNCYGTLLQRQIQVLEGLEKHLWAAIFTAQVSMHRKHYRSLSSIEATVATTFATIFISCSIASVLIYFFFKVE